MRVVLLFARMGHFAPRPSLPVLEVLFVRIIVDYSKLLQEILGAALLLVLR
ncbi:hypothetical protein LINGRAHAP2_LOCUS7103 [Linum grandiflorum]